MSRKMSVSMGGEYLATQRKCRVHEAIARCHTEGRLHRM